MKAEPHEISTDGRTVWINGAVGLLGRFSWTGIDVHVDARCVDDSCEPGPCTLEHWSRFKEKMIEYHGIRVSDDYMPNYLKEKNDAHAEGEKPNR